MSAPNRLCVPWIFFDVGGTLIRVAQPVGETYARVANHYGARWDPTALDAGFRRAFKSLRPREPGTVPNDGNDRAFWKTVVRESASDQEWPDAFPFDDFFEEVYQLYARGDMWRVFPDVVETLETLRARGFRLGVLSNYDERLRPLLRDLELLPYFERVFASACLGREKPDPALYAHVAAAVGADAAELLLVGDEEMNDYWAPINAGWHAMLIERPERGLLSVLDCVETGLPK